jgi:precorrin-2/cobalt-factor-2 C20-methyltransferase
VRVVRGENVEATMKGKLFGIGTGPGDPELLTVKAINAIRYCDVIAVPKTGDGERTAFSIIEQYLDGKDLLECRFSMEKDLKKREESRIIAADEIVLALENGKNVGYITLGDPTTYSTYMYIHKIVTDRGFETEIIPGITSFAAAAAALGISLCEGRETLTIIPANHSEEIGELLDRPGNKVIMKSGSNLENVLEELKKRGYKNRTKIASHVTMEDQSLFNSIEDFERSGERGYFTIAIVKEKV